MSERRDIPGPSKRKAPEENLSDAFYEFSPFKKLRPDDDPTPPGKAPHEKWPGPKPRFSHLLIAPEEGHNVPRTLNQQEANPSFPLLRLVDTFEACIVLDCPRFIDYSMMFRVFDVHNTTYYMRLLHRVIGPIELVFDHGWIEFAGDHNLGAGDQISFDKNLDTTISDDFYYNLKFVKMPKSSKITSVGAESSKKPGDDAESCKKLGDDAESSKKPGGDTESSKKPCVSTESSKKPGDDAESSKKPGDDAENSKKPGDDAESDAGSSSSVPALKMPVFKVIYHRVLLETPPDQEQRNAPRPGSRPFQLEAIFLSKTLTAAEVGSRLFFDVYDAIVLADNPRVAEILPGDISMEFMVFDGDNRQYDMTLLHHVRRGGIIGFCLDGWDGIVRNHDLRQGDRVAFYKFLDRRISNGYYYVVLKLPPDVDRRYRRNPVRPGSSKALSQNDVAPGNAGLQLEASQARHFESSSRSLNEPFMVFDGYDRRYGLKLSYFFIRGQGLVCFLDNFGWQAFVENHDLIAGDRVHVYKILDHTVCDDHYFVIRYTRT
ncbi:myomodulin neuropeptides 1 [Phtheirospermum japonicum]|uniref:Myomodulin neuropeptides 1 n=1 Tax=Phtheirospermum japonicum TaxID=374723 RepID=A0A830CMD6_9LAMI|nr:myomodulin neuropeptides 1 [Phtheirospermum japonicum]